MKISQIRVKNFRTIGSGPDGEGVVIDFGEHSLIFLIGKNNTGKSALLEAYDMFVTAAQKASEADFHNKNPNNQIEIEAFILAETEEDRKHKSVSAWLDDRGVARIRKRWVSVGEQAIKESWSPAKMEWTAGGAGGFDTILQNGCPTPVWIRGMASPGDVISSIQNLVKATILKKIKETDAYKEAETAIVKLQGEVEKHEYASQIERNLNNIITKIFPDISFRVTSEGEQDFSKMLSSQTGIHILEKERPELTMEYHGHGVRRQFVLSAYRGLSDTFELVAKHAKKKDKDKDMAITAIPERAEAKTHMLLYEEPELFLHPDPMRIVKNLIYALAEHSEFQIVAATQAPIMIDLSRPHTTLVRVTSTPQAGTILSQVTQELFSDDDRERMKMLNRFDPYVCEAFFADRLVLVEGDTETVAARSLMHRLREEAKIEASDFVHVVNCGSKMYIPFFQRILRHFRIPYFVLHDLDSKVVETGRANPAWSVNTSIWEEMSEAKSAGITCRRFVFTPDFERAHEYESDRSLGKPFSAFKQSIAWDLGDTSKPMVAFLLHVLGKHEVQRQFTSDELEELHSGLHGGSGNNGGSQ